VCWPMPIISAKRSRSNIFIWTNLTAYIKWILFFKKITSYVNQ
jgi:hypothetical protein